MRIRTFTSCSSLRSLCWRLPARESSCTVMVPAALAPAVYGLLNIITATGIIFSNKAGTYMPWGPRRAERQLGMRLRLPPCSPAAPPPCDPASVCLMNKSHGSGRACPTPSTPPHPPPQPNRRPFLRSLHAVFSIYKFHFTYALTFIHTVVTFFGMQAFLRVSVAGCTQAAALRLPPHPPHPPTCSPPPMWLPLTLLPPPPLHRRACLRPRRCLA